MMGKIIFQNFKLMLLFLLVFGSNFEVKANSLNDGPIVKGDATYKVLVKRNIIYAEGLHDDGQSSNTVAMPLLLDLYAPDNDLKNRPVILFIHGGSFKGGSRKKKDIVDMANYFASRGWVFVSIDYRTTSVLGNNYSGVAPQKWRDTHKDNAQINAIYAAQRDAKAAVRWLVSNANTYHINTKYITVGGGSAGAITAIGVGISAQEDFRDEMSTKKDPTLLTTNLHTTFKIRSIINFWGNDAALKLLKNTYGHNRFDGSDPELFIAHGTKDRRKVPYSGALELIEIYESTGVYAKLIPIEGRAHAPWDANVKGKSLSDLVFDFLVERQELIVEN